MLELIGYYLLGGLVSATFFLLLFEDIKSLQDFAGSVLLWPLFALAIVWKILIWFCRSVTSGLKILKEFV